MHLLFDLDGTLADSRPGIISSIRQSLEAAGLPVPAAEELHWCIGPPILHSFEKLMGLDSPHLFTPTVEDYRKRYREVGIFDCTIYPEIPETLAALKAAGYTLHVATSKALVFAETVIDHFGLRGYFTSVNGSELDGTRADKAELIAYILETQGIPKERVFMIGDREHDMIGAVKNGIPGIGALWGYGSGKELMGSGATACVRVPRLLPEILESLIQ